MPNLIELNSVPHIGHAFEFILADAISKFLKTKTDVHFNVELDEHGLKVWSKAKELGISPEQHIEKLTKVWLDFCDKFQIKYVWFDALLNYIFAAGYLTEDFKCDKKV